MHDSLTARAQCGQGGRTTLVEPAARSASMRRNTEGTGASAPSPVSRPGRSSRAQASWRRCPDRDVVACTAVTTTVGSREGSTPVTTRVTTKMGSSPAGGHR